MSEYATSVDIRRLREAWYAKARSCYESDWHVSATYFECADALGDLGPLPPPDDPEERRAHINEEVMRGAMTPNRGRELLGLGDVR